MFKLSSDNPIDVKSLWDVTKVFAVYGAFLTIWIIVKARLFQIGEVDAAGNLLNEPIATVSCGVLLIIGLVGVMAAYVLCPSGTRLRDVWLVRKWAVPTLNAGLSAGAIMIGFLAGSGLALLLLSHIGIAGHADGLYAIGLLKSALLVLMLVAGISLQSRNLFVESLQERKFMLLLVFAYCAFVLGSLWYLARDAFSHAFVGLLTACLLVAAAFVYRWAKGKKLDWLG
ncbi:hypothetical protein [Dyella psychrodurans]|uniref:Uncharacterized protein n=1 Tax=Dyella psychrodurans TaxID=1927960 RepID=A0A370X7G9_9GAMM|nr:hypothetical protein [Dyella psychrodurans]RDS84145.1 hypothetical protein DWU99_10340 [Dyella psychrodurans]